MGHFAAKVAPHICGVFGPQQQQSTEGVHRRKTQRDQSALVVRLNGGAAGRRPTTESDTRRNPSPAPSHQSPVTPPPHVTGEQIPTCSRICLLTDDAVRLARASDRSFLWSRCTAACRRGWRVTTGLVHGRSSHLSTWRRRMGRPGISPSRPLAPSKLLPKLLPNEPARSSTCRPPPSRRWTVRGH